MLTARVLGQFIPDSPILTIGEIWSETLAGTDVPPRLYSDVKGLQIQSQTKQNCLQTHWSHPDNFKNIRL